MRTQRETDLEAEIECLTAELDSDTRVMLKMQEEIERLQARVEELATELKEWESGALVRGWREIRAATEQGEKDVLDMHSL